MDEQTPDGSEPPKFFRNMNAWIGGATGLVIAVTGLYAAIQRWPDKPAEAAAPAANVDDSTADDAAAAEPAVPAENTRTAYTTEDGGTLRWIDGMWVWTTKDGDKYRYKEESNDTITTVAVLKGGGEKGQDVYLRWPNAGGQAFQSFDDQATWTDPVSVTPE
ncbi:MAG: hypothetical protein ABI422_00255 [Sphingomicrobium sp.]